MHKYNRWIL